MRLLLHAGGAASLLFVSLLAFPAAWLGLTLLGRRPRPLTEQWIGIDRRVEAAVDAARHERRDHDLGGRPFSATVLHPVMPSASPPGLGERLATRLLHVPTRLWHLLRRDLNLVGPRPGRRDDDQRTAVSSRAGVRPGILAPAPGTRSTDPRLAEHAYRLLRTEPRHHLRADLRALAAAARGLTKEARA